jgi:hypothetical protein
MAVVFTAGLLSQAVIVTLLTKSGINSKHFLFIVIPEEFVSTNDFLLHAGWGSYR